MSNLSSVGVDVDVDVRADSMEVDNGLNSPHSTRRKESLQKSSTGRKVKVRRSLSASRAPPPETPPAMRRIFSRKNTSARVPTPEENEGNDAEDAVGGQRQVVSAPETPTSEPDSDAEEHSHPGSSILAQTDSHGNQKGVAVEVEPQHDEPTFLGSPFLGHMLSNMCCTSCVDGYEHGGRLTSTPGGRKGVSKMYKSYSGRMKFKTSSSTSGRPVLGPVATHKMGKICLVLDLDETLVHSSFKPVPAPDYIIPVEIDGTTHNVYVKKRPGVDDFMKSVGERYEVVVYTASLKKYADPLLDLLDVHKVINYRLFRESCTCHQGNYVKDLSVLGRELPKIIIVDNSPASYLFQPQNAIGISSFIDDPADTELIHCQHFLEKIHSASDVVEVLPRVSHLPLQRVCVCPYRGVVPVFVLLCFVLVVVS